MDIEKARKLVASYQKLIGTVNDKGFVIDHILIVPRNPKSRQSYFKVYVTNLEMEEALAPFVNEDLDIWAVDFTHVQDSQTLFFNKLSE